MKQTSLLKLDRIYFATLQQQPSYNQNLPLRFVTETLVACAPSIVRGEKRLFSNVSAPVSIFFFAAQALYQWGVSKNNIKLNPWFITGFCDGEACFSINVIKHNAINLRWTVNLHFSISVHKKDKAFLEEIKTFFKVGSINWKHGPKSIQFRVYSKKELKKIIDHFEKYPLITDKWPNYKLFSQAFELIEMKEHLTEKGFQKILSIKASMNWGLSDKLKETFPDIILAERPIFTNKEIPDPHWLAGFTSAEGCFLIVIFKAKTNIGEGVQLIFELTQHVKDKQLIKSLIKYFDCGNTNYEGNVINYKVTKFGDITQKIIPFFKKTPYSRSKISRFCRLM